ncbi:hypothetical protein F383_29507 [Gossypium arboreum]|uniref:Uncharacterized protein n=1 Tax=Gossypium arboreum TaxID=29729 RepID=A0A0B0MZL2_GOSAR|nr:uncharacterized protein LOC108462973 [Gossypium arboreum]KHG04341.1 hypothetical protein F383_29507 [Gossypium arboreum]
MNGNLPFSQATNQIPFARVSAHPNGDDGVPSHHHRSWWSITRKRNAMRGWRLWKSWRTRGVDVRAGGRARAFRHTWWRGAERGGCGVGNLRLPRLAEFGPSVVGSFV